MAENPTTPKERQELDAQPESQREPLTQRPAQEVPNQVGGAFVVEDDVATQSYHVPGRPLPEQEEETGEHKENAERDEEHRAEVLEEHPVREVNSHLRVYAERDNIVHPGPTVQQLVTDEDIVGEEFTADAEIVLNPVAEDRLDEDETARDRLHARRESIRGERLA